jgi:transglutaminase-like putative cysteine protease
MKLRITHSTRYLYPTPVERNANELRLTPKKSPWQELEFSMLRVLPSARLRRFNDFYGNHVSYFEVEEPHATLSIEATSNVTTRDRYGSGMPEKIPLASLEDASAMELIEPFLAPTNLVEIPPEIWRAAVDVRSEHNDVFGMATGIMEYIHKTCKYVPGATTVNTTSSAFAKDPRGVCQDFAHLMLAMCRSVQLPARYVSGYLFDAKRTEVRGAHASHAWVEIWLPGLGWHGMDPTNNCLTHENYVVLAAGRDYHDVPPVKGSFWGAPEREMQVTVHLEQR